MKLIEAFQAGHKLVMVPNPEDATERPVGALYPTDWGVLVLDPDWDQNDTGHPLHFLDGDELGKGPWVVGNAYFSVIPTGHRFYAGISAWYQRRKTEEGLYEMEQAAVERHIQERKQWNKKNVDIPA